MASFNLGRIKGDKGDTGPKGTQGEKGDRGETGAKGSDGITPVFSVGGVETVDFSQSASVVIKNDNPANPKLFFHIPRGKNGIDAMGDMQKAVYDKEGRETDFYEFAQNLQGQCLLKSGGSLSGKLIASPSAYTQRCVRNVMVAQSLPDDCADGDICIITSSNIGVKIGEYIVGSTILLREDEKDERYIVVAKDYHGKDTVTLMRKYLLDEAECFDYNRRNRYVGSYIDLFLDAVFKKRFPDSFTKNLKSTDVGSMYKRQCFIPSREELEGMSYFSENDKLAYTIDSEIPRTYMTRTVGNSKNIYCVSDSGKYVLCDMTEPVYYRPFVVVPSDMIIINEVSDGETVSKFCGTSGSIYIYSGGEWRDITPPGDK